MRHVLPVAVRSATLSAGIVAYFFLVVRHWGEKGDANIGAGLLAFGLVLVASLGWAAYDGHHDGAGRAIGVWLGVASVVTLLWVGLLLLATNDGTLTRSQMLADAAVIGPMTFGLVAGPAVIGAAVGQSARRDPA